MYILLNFPFKKIFIADFQWEDPSVLAVGWFQERYHAGTTQQLPVASPQQLALHEKTPFVTFNSLRNIYKS